MALRLNRILAAAPGCLLLGLAFASPIFFVSAVSAEQAAPTLAPQVERVESRAQAFSVETIARELQVVWGMVSLPDGRLLLTERDRPGLRLLDPATGHHEALQGAPDDVFVQANAGMLDVALHPDYADNGWIYYSYVAGSAALNTTVVERARLDGTQLVDRERIFTVLPWHDNAIVYGCRLVFHQGDLYLTMGDRWDLRYLAQSPGTHIGKVLRLRDDGSAPPDNPFVGLTGAMPEVWTLGNRNPQGLAVRPGTDQLWSHEHGPKGGDEVNLLVAGANYGWPLVSLGTEYDGRPIVETRRKTEGLVPPVHHYIPSIAPSDMLFVEGSAFRGWRGNLLLGALGGQHLNRLVLEGDAVVEEERLLADRGWRIRSLLETPDGAIYLGTDQGDLVRLRALD
jgi:aldose sugar dehydrogenase